MAVSFFTIFFEALLAHRAMDSPTSSSFPDKSASAHSSSAQRARDTDARRADFLRLCSRIALWTRLLRRRSQTKARPLTPCTLLAPLAEAGAGKPMPSSLARRRKTRLLAHSSRTAARQPGSARASARYRRSQSRFLRLCSRIALWTRLLRRRSQTKARPLTPCTLLAPLAEGVRR